MFRIFAKVSLGFLLFLNVAFASLFLAASFSSQVDPGVWWVAGFLPLLIPYLLVVVLLFAVLWLFVRPRRALLSLVAVGVASGPLLNVIPPRLSSGFEMGKAPGSLRVMTWNLRHFAPFKIKYLDSEKMTQQESIRLEVERFKPDVLCFQEFVNIHLSDDKDVIGDYMEKLGFTHHYFAGDRYNLRKFKTGMVIFSKLPILQAELVDYPKELDQTGEKSIMADVRVGADTVRFYSIHLQSFGFLPRDYWTFRRIKSRNDSGMASARSLLTKMKQTFQFHSQEARYMASAFAEGPRLKVICGDMNDVPSSYAYNIIRADRKDAHREKGYGLGKTYTSPSSRTMGKLPSLRIDHIFTDPVFEVLQTTRGKALLSDHQAVVADIRLPQKE
jgi:endonuclease/exonuclease/phosphatase family metal-dependent hydrolase